MASWFHTAVLATVIAATAAVGLAAASIIAADNQPAPKADRLPVVANNDSYVTVETRHNGLSVLSRIEIN